MRQGLAVGGLTVALLGATAPGAMAAGLTLSPTSGPPGTKVTATATGFAADDALTFKVRGHEVGDDAANASGGGSAKFRIPRDVDNEPITVVVRSEPTRKAAKASFNVRVLWAQLGGGPGHNNANRFERGLGPDVAADLEPLWIGATGAPFDRSSPIRSTTTVYAMRSSGQVGAFNELTGSTISGWSVAGVTSLSTPAVSGSLLYTADQQGLVRAWNTGSKAVVWTGNANGAVSGALTVAGTNVYAGSEDGNVYAFPLSCSATCTPQWVGNVGSPVRGGVAVANDRVYALGLDGRLRAFPVGCATGGQSCQPIDTAPDTTSGTGGQPVAAGGRVLITTIDNVYAYSGYCLACGPMWSGGPANGLLEARPGPVLANGKVFAVVRTQLLAFDATCGDGGATCAPLWQAQVSHGGAAYADGMVWVEANSRLLGFKADCGTGGVTCKPLVSIPTPAPPTTETTPMVADGRIYIGVGASIAAYAVPDS